MFVIISFVYSQWHWVEQQSIWGVSDHFFMT